MSVIPAVVKFPGKYRYEAAGPASVFSGQRDLQVYLSCYCRTGGLFPFYPAVGKKGVFP